MRNPERLPVAAATMLAAAMAGAGCDVYETSVQTADPAKMETVAGAPDAGHTLVVEDAETKRTFSQQTLANAFNRIRWSQAVLNGVKFELREELGVPAAEQDGCFPLPEVEGCHPQDCIVCATTLDRDGDLPMDAELKAAIEAMRRVVRGSDAASAMFSRIERRNAGQGDHVACGRFNRLVTGDNHDDCQLSPDAQRGVKPSQDPTPFRIQQMGQGGEAPKYMFGPTGTAPVRNVGSDQIKGPPPPDNHGGTH